MKRAQLLAFSVIIALIGVACSKSSNPASPASSSASTTTSPSATPSLSSTPSVAPSGPAVGTGYYDGHKDAFVSTDVSNKAQAKADHINYSPALAALNAKKFPAIYMVMGKQATGQLMVFGSQPGETDYSPLWDEVNVTWKSSTTPVLLTSDNQIKSLASRGKLTMRATSILLNCPIIAVGKATATLAQGMGYYDGHKDGFASTDVSTKAQAKADHINYSPGLAALNAKKFPAIYMVMGKQATGQLMVFGSQPGETDYSPIWDEVNVTWKAGATPVLLTSDNQIKNLVAKGKLTMKATSISLNCPITSVGKG